MAAERKIDVTVGFTPRQTTLIDAEAKRVGISFADQVRRIADWWADRLPPQAANNK